VEAIQQVLVQWSNWPPELTSDLGRLGLHEADFPVCACLGASGV
jgi:hypothetical protein